MLTRKLFLGKKQVFPNRSQIVAQRVESEFLDSVTFFFTRNKKLSGEITELRGKKTKLNGMIEQGFSGADPPNETSHFVQNGQKWCLGVV